MTQSESGGENARAIESVRERTKTRERVRRWHVCVWWYGGGRRREGGRRKGRKGARGSYLPSEKFVAARDCAQLVCLELRIRQLKQLPCWHRRACCYVSAARQTTVRQHIATAGVRELGWQQAAALPSTRDTETQTARQTGRWTYRHEHTRRARAHTHTHSKTEKALGGAAYSSCSVLNCSTMKSFTSVASGVLRYVYQ